MASNDLIADSMSKINNAVKALYKVVILRRNKLMVSVLEVLKNEGYVGSYEVVEDGRGGKINVNLLGTINKCGIIKPRYPVKIEELEAFEKRFLPAKDFGVLIISTNKGLLTQREAREKNVGGVLVAYCY